MLRFSMPSILAMLVGVLYAAADRFFVAQAEGPAALAGLTVAFPIFMIVIAVQLLCGAGGNALLSINLGQKDDAGVRRVISNTLFLQIALGVLLTAATLIFMEPLLALSGGSAATIPIAREYLSVLLLAFPLDIVAMGLNQFVRSFGFPKTAMINSIAPALLNIVLDYIFIMEMDMGVFGAALGSAISMLAGFVMVMWFWARRSPYKLRLARPDFGAMAMIAKFGMTAFFVHFAIGFNMMFSNNILAKYGGDIALGSWAIAGIVDQVFTLPVFGLANAMQSIGGYNFGAGLWDRVRECVRKSIFASTIWLTISGAAIFIFAGSMTGLFGSDAAMLSTADWFLKVFAAGYPFLGVVFLAGIFFNMVGRYGTALILSLIKFAALPIPALILFARLWGLDGFAWAWPATNVVSFAIFFAAIAMSWRRIGTTITPAKF